MGTFQWNDSLSVGVKAMDEEHKRLVKLVDELDDAMRQGQGREVMKKTFDGLVTYAATHFKTEENLMRENGYPGFEEHAEKHDAMTQQVLNLQRQVRENQATITLKTMNFLTDWLTKHIQGTDKQYGIDLNQKGIY